MKTRRRTRKEKLGNIIKIRIDEDTYCIGRVVSGGFIEFYDLKLRQSQLGVIDARVAGALPIFTLSVHKSWESNENWEVIGNNPDNIPPLPSQFMQSITYPDDLKIIDPSGIAKAATMVEVQGMERLAVWEDNHVEDRLRDHFEGRQNTWVELLKPTKP